MRKLLIGTVFLAGLLAGCSDDSTIDQSEEITELKKKVEQISAGQDRLIHMVKEHKEFQDVEKEPPANGAEDNVMVKAEAIEDYPETLYRKKLIDIDADGEEKTVELYVDAEELESGLFAWDDGQKWLLVVKDGESTYPLFDDFVQLGEVDFGTTTVDGKFAVVMMKSTHDNTYVYQFTYEEDEDGFKKETIYEVDNESKLMED